MTAKTSAEYMREWVARPGNREKKREMNRRYYAKARSAGKITKDNMEVRRFQKHGTSKSEFEQLIESQGGVCAICAKPGDWSTLLVDHDHDCCPGQFSCGNCIRGALCKGCNTALGLLQENPLVIESALAYMTRERANHGA